MKNITYRKLLIWLVALPFAAYIIYGFASFFFTIESNPPSWSKISLPMYNNLFSAEAQTKLQILSTNNGKHSEAESTYLYDKRYYLFVTRVISIKNTNLKNIINLKQGVSNMNNGDVYSTMSNEEFEMHLKIGATDTVSKINIKYTGSPIKEIFNNGRLACYNLMAQSFSWSYNENTRDYYIVAYSYNSNSYPAQIAFVQKGQYIYIVLLSFANGTKEMPSDLLSNILNK